MIQKGRIMSKFFLLKNVNIYQNLSKAFDRVLHGSLIYSVDTRGIGRATLFDLKEKSNTNLDMDSTEVL